MKSGKIQKKNTGFLLLEAILAITIISIGTAAIMRTYTTSLAAGIISQQYLQASNLIEELMWKTLAQKEIMGGLESGTFDPPFNNYSWEISIEEKTPEFEMTEEIAEIPPEELDSEVEEEHPLYLLYIIKVTVSWNYRKDKKELTYQTATMRKQPETEEEDTYDETPLAPE